MLIPTSFRDLLSLARRAFTRRPDPVDAPIMADVVPLHPAVLRENLIDAIEQVELGLGDVIYACEDSWPVDRGDLLLALLEMRNTVKLIKEEARGDVRPAVGV